MIATEPLPLHHSWPLFEAAQRMTIPGIAPFVVDGVPTPSGVAPIDGLLAARGIGVWECDLANGDALRWTGGVHDLFGLPRDEPVTRPLAVSLYTDDSRRAMEQLRAHAIRFRRGFMVDAEICRPDGEHRWMRLSAVPVIVDGKVARLCGLKVDVTAEYGAATVQPRTSAMPR